MKAESRTSRYGPEIENSYLWNDVIQTYLEVKISHRMWALLETVMWVFSVKGKTTGQANPVVLGSLWQTERNREKARIHEGQEPTGRVEVDVKLP